MKKLIKMLKPLRALSPKRRRALRKRAEGNVARDRRQWAKAALAYEEYLVVFPGDAGIWVQRGHSHKEAGDLSGAEIAYRRALEIDPENGDTFLQLGHLLKMTLRAEVAVDAYKQAAALGDKHALDELKALDVPYKPKQSSKEDHVSGKNLDSILNAGAGERFRILVDAQAARDHGDWKVAATLYRKFLSSRPGAANIWGELAFVLRRDGNGPEAVEAIQRAISLDPAARYLKQERAAILAKR